MVKVFTTNKNGKIEFTEKELEKLLNEVWNDGHNANTYRYWWSSPMTTTRYWWSSPMTTTAATPHITLYSDATRTASGKSITDTTGTASIG